MSAELLADPSARALRDARVEAFVQGAIDQHQRASRRG